MKSLGKIDPVKKAVQGLELTHGRSPKFALNFSIFSSFAGKMAANAADPSPSARSSLALLEISTATAWKPTLGLYLNVLNDDLTSIAPELLPFVAILRPAARTVDGSAAIDSAISALAPFATLHAKLSSLRAPALQTELRPKLLMHSQPPNCRPRTTTVNFRLL